MDYVLVRRDDGAFMERPMPAFGKNNRSPG
jgi:hypothetical protein